MRATVTTDDLSRDTAVLAAEVRRRESRVVGVSTRTSSDDKTVLIIETAGMTTSEVGALSDTRKALRRRRDLAAEFRIVNSTGGVFAK